MTLFGTLALLLAGPADLAGQRMRIGSSNPTGHTAGFSFTSCLFAAGDTNRGVELWRHDASGTGRLLDIYPASGSSYPTEITRRLRSSGNTWFVARTRTSAGELGRELHYYPNLPTNTLGSWIRDIRPGPESSHPAELTLLGSTVIFSAHDGSSGREIWRSDGTAAGTVRIRDIVPGAGSSNPFGLTLYNGRVYFAATTALEGTELWATDGTAAGTVLVRDVYPGGRSSTPSHFAVYQNRLYFAARDQNRGRELWCTSGTTVSTVLVADIEPGSRSSSPTQLTAGNGLAFTASRRPFGRELFIYNGSLIRKSNLVEGESIEEITPSSGLFWFRARQRAFGAELWRTTTTGVTMVHDLRAGIDSSFPENLFPYGRGVIFRANNGITGSEYWRTDGTTATLIHDIRSASCSARPSKLMPMSKSGRPIFLFSAKGNDTGIELWQTNGLTASMVSNIDPLTPLPEMHWGTTRTTMSIDIKDADPLQPAFIAISATAMQPLPLQGFRGALSLGLPFFIIFQSRTDPRGQVNISFPAPPILQRTTLLSQAALGTASGIIELTTAATCNHGERQLTPPTGPRVKARVCLDDESGEYTICAERIDAFVDQPAYLGLYQKGPGGDLELLQTYPINPGEFIEDSGQIEILLPLEGLDAGGRHLEIHLFISEPGPDSATASSLVVQSYC